METSNLFCYAKQMTGFYMKRNTSLEWVKSKTLSANSKLRLNTLHLTSDDHPLRDVKCEWDIPTQLSHFRPLYFMYIEDNLRIFWIQLCFACFALLILTVLLSHRHQILFLILSEFKANYLTFIPSEIVGKLRVFWLSLVG